MSLFEGAGSADAFSVAAGVVVVVVVADPVGALSVAAGAVVVVVVADPVGAVSVGAVVVVVVADPVGAVPTIVELVEFQSSAPDSIHETGRRNDRTAQVLNWLVSYGVPVRNLFRVAASPTMLDIWRKSTWPPQREHSQALHP